MSADFDAALRELVADLVREEFGKLRAAEPAEIMTCQEAANRARVCVVTVRRWIRDGRLPEHRAGRQIRVLRRELDELLRRERRTEQPGEP